VSALVKTARRILRARFMLLSQVFGAPRILRCMGATVGEHCHIAADLCVYNMHDGAAENLVVGNHVYVGPHCVFDLTAPIILEDYVSVSAGVRLITHLDVGSGPLGQYLRRREGPIQVRRGAWIGAGATILHGVEVGESAAVGAMALVTKRVRRGTLNYGIPSREIREITE
jgi:acetyltransferase-like isoleucine patch superfamily enzyme